MSTHLKEDMLPAIDTTSLVKILILWIGSVHIWKALSPPHTSARTERLTSTFIGRFALGFSTFLKIAHFFSCLFETVLIVSHHYVDVPITTKLSTLCAPRSGSLGAISITNTFLAGSALAIAGAQLRLACFRALGRLFTFEMAIRSSHKLITNGPYAYVRHPAYTGLIVTMLGESLIQLGAGSWLRECGSTTTGVFKLYPIALTVPMVLISFSVATRRLWNEDLALQKQFGDEWARWAKKTPYRLIPFVY